MYSEPVAPAIAEAGCASGGCDNALRGMVALSTGASRGLGRALALAFAREGTSLALCSRGQDALEQVAALGSSVLAVPVDLRSTRDLDRLVAPTPGPDEPVGIPGENSPG